MNKKKFLQENLESSGFDGIIHFGKHGEKQINLLDLLKKYESLLLADSENKSKLEKAFSAGYKRATWEEIGYGSDEEYPAFEEWFIQEYLTCDHDFYRKNHFYLECNKCGHQKMI